MDAQQQALRGFTKYIWWKTPDEALQYERRLLPRS